MLNQLFFNTKTIIKDAGCVYSVRETDDDAIIIAITGNESDEYANTVYTIEVYSVEI